MDWKRLLFLLIKHAKISIFWIVDRAVEVIIALCIWILLIYTILVWATFQENTTVDEVLHATQDIELSDKPLD